MCGIVAIIGKDSSVLIENALKKIKHRGLDATKIIADELITFGFNRLAINDKSENGHQPFEYGNLVGVFNAEIYNSEELKSKFGLSTISKSDTELILPLFEKLGKSIIHYLDGFYSGIIFNKVTKQLFVIKDYIGKKPLFYVKSNNFYFIVSELKAVNQIDCFQIIPKGFSEIIGGQIKTIEMHKISNISKDNLKQVVISAIEKRIPKEEKHFGVFLSGGLDSSIIASVISKLADKVTYYTLGGNNSTDLQYVNLLSKYLDIEQKLKIVDLPAPSDIPKLLNKIVYHTESYNPSIISNGLATFLLSRAAFEDGIKVILSGEGADELFCGYPISKNINEWFEKRTELIENLHLTELRRLDLSSMAQTIEVRCPFLDRKVYAASINCSLNDLILKTDTCLRGKLILRNSFNQDLPTEITERNKISFDVGSGIRKIVVEYLTRNGKTEREMLKEIWSEHFAIALSEKKYFYSYPTFDRAIEKRGIVHK